MSKFCTNCGKELKDGKCDCVKKTNVGVQSNDLGNKFIEVIKGLFIKPITTIKENTNEANFTFGLISLIVVSMLTGLFTYFFLKDGSTALTALRLYGLYNISFMKIFVSCTILAAIWYIVLGFVTYLFANKLFKLNVTVKEIFTFLGIVSILMSLALLISILLIYVSVKLMILVLLLGSLFYSVYYVIGLMEVTNIDKDKIAYLYVPSMLVAFFLVYYVLPKLLSL